MTSRFVIIASAALIMGGCATVDFQSFGGEASTEVSEPIIASNVVKRAVAQLDQAFDEGGFGSNVEMSSSMAMAADILMNGMPEDGAQTASVSYTDQDRTLPVILSDISTAEVHVEKTTRAAQVYYETAPLTDDFTDELAALEGALLKSERARTGFEKALSDIALSDTDPAKTPSLDGLRTAIEELRRITDDYGIRVRQRRLQRLSDTDAAS